MERQQLLEDLAQISPQDRWADLARMQGRVYELERILSIEYDNGLAQEWAEKNPDE